MRGQRTRRAGVALLLFLLSGAYWHFRAPQPAPRVAVAGTITPQIAHAGGIRAFAIAPDGKSVATLGETIKLWDMQSGALQRTISLPATPWQPRNLRFSPDGSMLAFLDDTPQGTFFRAVNLLDDHSSAFQISVGYSPDFAFIESKKVCLNVNGQLKTYDVKSGQLLQQTNLAAIYPWGAVASGMTLTGRGQRWSIFNLQSGETQNLQRDINLQAAAFSADGRTLATAQNRLAAQAPVAPLPSKNKKITLLIVNADSDVPHTNRAVRPPVPAKKAPDGTIALWNTKGKLQRVISAFPGQVGVFRGVALSPDGKLVAAYGNEAYKGGHHAVLRQWDCESGQLKGEWPLNADGFVATALAVGNEGTVSVAGLKNGENGMAGAPQVWNSRASGWQSHSGAGLADEWRHLEWSPNGAFLAGGSEIGAPSNLFFGGFQVFGGRYFAASSIVGAMPTFVFGGGAGFHATTIRLWDLQNGALRAGFWGPIVPPQSAAGQGVTALQQGGLASVLGVCAFSPDNRLLAVDEGGTIALRDVQSGAIVRVLGASPSASLPATLNIGDWSQFLWSPQGNTLIALTKAGANSNSPTPASLSLWNTQNGKLKAVLATSARDMQAAYSTNGAIVALVNNVPRAWDENGMALNVAALPAIPRGTKQSGAAVLTRQGHIIRALRTKKALFLETRAVLTGKIGRYEFPAPFNGASYAPKRLFVAPDGSSVAIQQENNALALWNLREWKFLCHIKNSAENPLLAPAPGGRFVAIARPEGAIQICDALEPSAPLTLQVLPSLKPRRGGREWAVFSPSGFCHTSPQAARQLKLFADGKMLPFAP